MPKQLINGLMVVLLVFFVAGCGQHPTISPCTSAGRSTTVSMRHNRTAGQAYLRQQVLEYACAARVPIAPAFLPIVPAKMSSWETVR